MRYRACMAYEKADGLWRWRKTPGAGDWIRGDLCPDQKGQRTIFCTQKEGTGINDPENPNGPIAGDATKGDCLHQFQVNDLK
jgi:hypothetical protein